MKSVRSMHRSVSAASLLVFALGAGTVGCEKEEKEASTAPAAVAPPPAAPPPPATPPPAAPPPAAPPPAAAPPAAPASDIKRYPNEQPLTGGGPLANTVPARKEAHVNGEVVETLPKGTLVNRLAQSGNWTLVAWRLAAGDKTGWVESAPAWGAQSPVPKSVLDEGRRRGVLFPR